MGLSAVISLLLAVALFARPAHAQATTCTFDISGLSLAATRGRAATGTRTAKISCRGAQLRLTVAPALQPYIDSFAGITATVDASATALLAISGGSVSIASSSLTGLDGGAGGSVLSISGGASVALEDTAVSGCSAAGKGSAVVAVSGATLSVSGSTFTGNFADYAGGAIGATNSRLTIAGSRFINNTADVLGGAINHIGTKSDRLAITGSTFTGNGAGCKGGAIYADGVASVTVDGTTFQDSSTLQSLVTAGGGLCADFSIVGGAAIFQERIPAATFTNSRFIGGRSAGDAGAMAQNNGRASTVRNCTFTDNQAQFGFVAALEQNAIFNTRVLGCTFTRNRGSNNGALLHQGCDTVLIQDTTFVSNTALVAAATAANAGSGGGGGGATLQLSCAKGCAVRRCNFTGNVAPGANGGGLLANSPNNLEVAGNHFQGNTAGNSGGGLAVIGSGDASGNSAVVTGNTFISNKVTDASGAGGGAVLYQLNRATAAGNDYRRNAATSFGGGLYILGLENTTARVTDSAFTENQSGASGGGMSVFATRLTAARNCTFNRNSALSSGALDFDTTTAFSLEQCTFRNNTAEQSGGAIGASSIQDANLTALAFTSNIVSGGSGGAVYASSFTSVNVAGCNFTKNQASVTNAASGAQGGAVALSTGDLATLDSCDFTGNSAGQSGGALAVLELTDVLVTATGFELNSAAGSGGAILASNLNYSIIIVDSGFDHNKAAASGGAIDLDTVLNVQINGTVFTNNTAAISGGAVASTNGGANLQFFDSQFGNNSATVSGGALSAVGTCGTALATSQFADNTAGTGGAIFLGNYGRLGSCSKGSCRCPPESRQSPAFDQVELDTNTATSGAGGALAVDGATDRFNISSSIFGGNTAFTDGGGIWLHAFSSNATTTISKTSFEGNQAQQLGGGLALAESPGMRLALRSGTFTENFAGLGGGMHADNETEIVMTALEFSGNVGDQGGGGVQCDGCTLFNATGSSFTGNNATAGGGGGFGCASCAIVMLQDTMLLRNVAGFGAGAALAGDPAARASIVESSFIENEADGSAGEGGGGGLQSGDGLLLLTLTTFRRNIAAGNGGGLLLSSSCPAADVASCGFASITGSTFNDNAAGGAGGALSSDGSTLPVALDCGTTSKSDLPTFADAAAQQQNFTAPSFPSGCKGSFVGNRAGAYGSDLATGPSSLKVVPTYVPRQRSNQRLPVTVNIVDDLGQQISGTGIGSDLVVSVVSGNRTLTTSGQTRVAALNGSAVFTGLTVRGPTETTPYTLSFVPAANALAPGADSTSATSGANVAAASLGVVIQPCIVGEVAADDICVECSVGTYSFDSGVPCQSCPEGAACYGGATLVPQPGYWHSAANSTQVQACPRRSACRYDLRTENLTECQVDWYAVDANTSLNYQQLTAQQAALPCTLWNASSSSTLGTYQQTQCAPGYKGPLCGACDRGPNGERYGFYSAFTCTRCKSDGLLVFLTILGFLLQFAFILFTIFSNISTNRQRYAEHEAQPSDFIKVLIIYLQYNFIASKLPLNWPTGLINFVGGIQIFFTSGEGIFSLDCLLQKNGSAVPLAIQRQIFSVVVPLVLLFLCAIFWVIWWYVVQPYQKKRRMSSTEERILAHAMAAGIDLPPIKEADEEFGTDSESLESTTPSLSPQTSVGKVGENGHLSPHSSGVSATGGDAGGGVKTAGDSLESAPSSKKNFNLDQLFRAIELEKMKSFDESRSPIERSKSMRRALSVELAIELERETFGHYVQRISIVSILVVCFFVYPTVCQAVLNTFACYHVDDGGGLYADNQLADWGSGYWQQDMEQRCYTGSHLTAIWAIGIPGVVLLCIGIPVATLAILLKIRDRLQEPRTTATYGFLYHQFKEGFFWWTVVDQLRLLILVIIVVFGRGLAPFVQLHLFIFVLLLSAAVSVMLQPHAWAGQMDLLSMSSIAFLMFMSLYFIGYAKQPSGPLTTTIGALCLVFDIVIIVFMLLITVTKTRKHFIGYWKTFLTYLGKARAGSLSVVRRAQQRRLLWQARSVRRRQAAKGQKGEPQLPVSSSAKTVEA